MTRLGSALRLELTLQVRQGFLYAAVFSGLIWLTGWLHREDRLEFPALLVDRSKLPAGVVLTCYDRPDLPD